MRERQREPVVIPRWLLTVKYFVFILVGAAVLNASSPTFDLAYDEPLTVAWPILLILTSVVTFVGSFRAEWEGSLEKWGVSVIFILMAIYAFAPIHFVLMGDQNRLAYSTIAILVSLLPYARALQLWGKKDA